MKREWLINYRKSRNMSQEELANKCDVKQITISSIENGQRRPSPELAQKIAKIFGFYWTKFYEDNDIQTQELNQKETS